MGGSKGEGFHSGLIKARQSVIIEPSRGLSQILLLSLRRLYDSNRGSGEDSEPALCREPALCVSLQANSSLDSTIDISCMETLHGRLA